MQGVRLSRTELEQRFRLSQRLMVRVGALLARQVDISAAVFELACPGSAIERLLLLPEVLSASASLTTAQLARLAKKHKIALEAPLAVQAQEGWRTILLEEELLAEKGWEAATPKQVAMPAERGLLSAVGPAPVAGTVFTAEEIERLKLDALTAADPAQKAASLRRLSLAPISEQEKASVFFRVLVDPVAKGRAEAISGLQALGFDPDAADALRDLLEGKEATRALAVERITALLGRLGEAHALIVVGVLLEMLRETDTPDLQHSLLLALAEATSLLAVRPDFAQEAVRLALKAVQLKHNQLASPARILLTRLAERDAERTCALLWEELERIRNHRTRVFVLGVLAQIGAPARLRHEMLSLMVAEIMESSAPEAERLLLGHSITALGEEAVEPLLAGLEGKHSEQRPFLIPFLETLCADRGIRSSAKNQIGRALLGHLKVGERRLRLAIVQSRICSDPDLDPGLRRSLAEELIRNLNEMDHPDVRERIEVNLERIGTPAIEPLFEFLKRHPLGTHADPRKNFTDHLARILGTILADATRQSNRVHERLPAVLDFCIQQIKDDRVKFGGYAVAAATLCAAGPVGPEKGIELIALLAQRLRAVAYPADILTALGIVASAEHIPLRQKIESAHIFLRVIAAQRRAPLAQARQTPDGVVYEFGKDADLDALMLPAAVVGAGQLCTSASTSAALRQMIIENLLKAWQQATSWRVTWGPLSTEKLASTLGMLGSHPLTPIEVRLEIAHAMKDQASQRLSAVRAMGDICAQPVKMKELDTIGLEVGEAIMSAWLEGEIEPEERRVVLTTLARIAARNEMDRRSARVRRFRERVLELAFNAARERYDEARTLLEILAGCEVLTKSQRKELEERLRSFYAVVASKTPAGH